MGWTAAGRVTQYTGPAQPSSPPAAPGDLAQTIRYTDGCTPGWSSVQLHPPGRAAASHIPPPGLPATTGMRRCEMPSG